MSLSIDPALVPPAPELRFEQALWKQGVSSIAGLDEAGRGALAGPVAVGAVIFAESPTLIRKLEGVRDSKLMTPLQRERWAERIRQVALAWGVGYASNREIDQLGISPATHLAARRALAALDPMPAHLLLDYFLLPDHPGPQTALIKGDARSLSIAAASILAKTSRDALMLDLDGAFPGYRFGQHKGYATAEHRRRLARLGASPVHRMSFSPCAQLSLPDFIPHP